MTELAARSDVAPGLNTFNGVLYVGWSDQREIHTLRSEDQGGHWGNDTRLNETSHHGPAIREFNGALYIAWTGTDDFALLNVKSSQDGNTFGNKITLREDSAFGPALTVFNDELYLAWVGVDPQRQLNIISSPDGTNFHNKQILGQSSIGSPALEVARTDSSPFGDPGEPLLLLAWTDPTGHLRIGGSTDGQTFQFGGPIGNEFSFTGPALLVEEFLQSHDTAVHIAWTGTDQGHHLNIMTSIHPEQLSDGFDTGTKRILNDSSPPGGPALTALFTDDPSTFFMSYVRGDDHHLNVVKPF
jgi:hypothetical protein